MSLQQNQLMLKKLKKNPLALRRFCKTGTLSYSNDKRSLIGEAAIINDSILISFIKDSANDSKISATVAFQNGYTLVLNMSGEDFYCHSSGKPAYNGDLGGFAAAKVLSANINTLPHNISTIMQSCHEAKETYSSKPVVNKLFTRRKISIDALEALLNQTLDNLDKTLTKQRRQHICPSFDPNKVSEEPSTHHDYSTSHSSLIQNIAR